MDDGTPLPERASLERVCMGSVRRDGYTDSRGYFTFSVGDRDSVTAAPDASLGSVGNAPAAGAGYSATSTDALRSSSLEGCQLRASLPGTVSDSILLTNRRPLDNPNVGNIVLHRIESVRGTTVSATSLQAPKSARAAFDRGRKQMKKRHFAQAKKEFATAVEQFPSYAEAWARLASIYLLEQDFDNAKIAGRKALAADPRLLSPYFPLMVLAATQHEWKDLADYSDKFIALDKYDYPAAHYYNALAYFKLLDLEKARASIEIARKLDPSATDPKIPLLMAVILMARSDYPGAAREFQAYLKRAPNGPDAPFARDSLKILQDRLVAAR